MRATTLTWIGGEHPFALALGNLRAVQRHCDAGPLQIFDRLGNGTWRVDDVFEVIRQGLIGGGMEQKEAGPLVAGLMDRHALVDFVLTARAVLAASLMGEEDDPVGKPMGETSPPESGASASSTETAPS